MSYINLSKFMFFPMLKAQLHHSHFSFSHPSSLGSKPNIFFLFLLFFFFFLPFFFFGLWIQLQVTHLALSSSFGLKHRLFMNFARLVHILCSIWPYENGLIKQFKHKDQCPIYNASPSCFGKFLFLWKTCLNLYSKWAMIFRSPHLFFSFLLFIFYFLFFWRKKVTKLYLNTSKSFTCPITKPILNVHSLPSFILKWALPLVWRVWSIG